MDITVTPQQLQDNAQLQQFAMFYLINGGPVTRDPVTGEVTYYFNAQGERMVSPEQFAYLVATGVKIDKATCYIEMPIEEYAGLVPVAFPESSYTDDQEVTQQREWSEYVPFATLSLDETKVLVQCVHVPFGASCGSGLSADELLIWWSQFPGRILTRSQGEALLAGAAYAEGAV